MNAVITLTSVLSDASGPVANESLDFQWSPTGANQWTDLGASTTDASGTATKSVTLVVGTKYDFKAIFAGDTTNNLQAASAELTAFLVTGATTLSLTAKSS